MSDKTKHRLKAGPGDGSPHCSCGYDPRRYANNPTFYQGVTMSASFPHPVDPIDLPEGVTPDRFVGRWPINDEGRTMVELIEEARHTLPVLIAQADALLVGPVAWHLKPKGGPKPKTYLVAVAPAIPYSTHTSALRP